MAVTGFVNCRNASVTLSTTSIFSLITIEYMM